MKIWNLSSGLLRKLNIKSKDILVKTLFGHKASVYTLIELNGGKLASGSNDSQVYIWDISNGRLLEKLNGHTGGVLSLSKIANGNLASSSADKSIRIWNV